MTSLPFPKFTLFLILCCLLGETSLRAVDKPTGKDEKKYETKVLWDFDGCIEDGFMNRVHLYVYHGNVYTWVLLPGYKTMIVKAPMDGGAAQMFPLMPGHVTGSDPHRFYDIAADSEGYIHVSGDMHSSGHVKHWISKKPEDISEFIYTSDLGGNKRPQGFNVTYPHFFKSPDGVLYHSIRCADPVWGLAISVLDVKTQTWSILGSDVPAADVTGSRAKKVSGKPLTAWEDNGEGGNYSYTQPHGHLCWDKNNRMHFSCAILNENTPSAKGRHTMSDVLYAYSDDRGKTFHRGDGTQIQLPMRAEAGPHQADIVYSQHEGPPPWLGLTASVRIDEKNRPTVTVQDHKSGAHQMVLEKGKWTDIEKNTKSPAIAQTVKPKEDDDDEEDDSEKMDVSKLHLPYEPHHQVLNEGGNLLYMVFPVKDRFHGYKPKWHRMMIVLSKPVQAATSEKLIPAHK